MLTADTVEAHVRTDGAVQWVKMEDLLADLPESCVDGRARAGIVGTPGGNAGEFILALTALENVTKRSIDLADMDALLARWIDACGAFYMHTDEHALEHFVGGVEDVLRHPTEERKRTLLEDAGDTDCIGCGHLRLMMQHLVEYGVRQELVAAAIQAIYRRLWSGSGDIDFVVLEGAHQEGAVVNVLLTSDDVTAETSMPTLAPMVGDQQIFVNHPQAVSFMRRDTARRIAAIAGTDVDSDAWLQAVEMLGRKQLTATVGHLAADLPVYNAVFSSLDRELVRVDKIA